jgi:hypothetical protein
MEVMAPNKYLFTVPQESHYQSIISQGPWNVRGSLLLLQPWSPNLAIDEVKLQFCAFWIQVHKLPLLYMTTQNAIKLGKGIGRILELDNNNSSGLICHQFLRFKIEINTSKPLASRFYVPCAGEESRWIAFKYERLDEYCTGCGLIGHNNRVCPTPQQLIPPDKYSRPLRASSYVSPRLVSKVQQEDFDSSISSAAFVGNSPSSVVPSQMLDSHGSTHSQLVTIANKIDFPIPSPNVFSMQHVDKSCSLVSAQPNQLLPNRTRRRYALPILSAHKIC